MRNIFRKYLLVSIVVAFAFSACQKDYSIEGIGSVYYVATGSLLNDAGDCQNIVVNGYYVKDTVLNASNNIVVQANFNSSGYYKIYTDTVNGCWFTMDSAYTYGGQIAVTLQGHGKPIVADTATFNVYLFNSVCSFTLITTPLPPHISTDDDYFPMTYGSNWTFDTMANAGIGDTLHFYVSPIHPVFNINGVNQTYTMFLSDHRDTNYYRKDSSQGLYYNYNTAFSQYNFYFEYIVLNDRVPVGTYWETPPLMFTVPVGAPAGNPGTYYVKMGCQITGKDIPMTLTDQTGTTIVDSVITVTETALLLTTPPNGYSPLYNTYTAYGKKVGLIYYNAQAEIPPIYRQARRWYIQ